MWDDKATTDRRGRTELKIRRIRRARKASLIENEDEGSDRFPSGGRRPHSRLTPSMPVFNIPDPEDEDGSY